MRHARFAGAGSLVLLLVMGSTPAWAQHVPFTRDFAAATITTLDVTTVRGKVDLVGSESGRVVVEGVATVRVGWNVPADAAEIAARVAQDPPVEMRGATLMLRPPRTDEERRAVTGSSGVHVP